MKFKLLILFSLFYTIGFTQGHEIKFDIKNLNDSIVFLARYYGDNKYIKDTIVTDKKGKFTIKGKEDLPCGIYLVVRQNRGSYLEFLVHDQKFSVQSDTSDFVGKTKFKGSESNTKLYEYFNFSTKINKERIELSDQIKALEENESKKEALMKKLEQLNKEMEVYIEDFIKNNPNNPMTVVFNMQKEVEIPEELKKDLSDEGKEKQYRYYLNHYWDLVNFKSECVIRTPIFHSKLQRYFDQVIPQHYDSVFKYIQPVVEKARGNDELFKYIVNYATFKWESGKEKRMCWDKVFYLMAKNYYLTGDATWVDEVKMAKIKSRVDDLQYALCGEQAVNLKMRGQNQFGLYDTLGKLHNLNNIKADVVIIWFWDSDCGHCKKQTPKLWELYDKYKKEGKSIEVYSINIETESEGYKKYLNEKGYTWINVQDTMHLSGFRKYYDIYSTPVSYILNKNKKIVGKRIDPEGMEKFLDILFKEEEENK